MSEKIEVQNINHPDYVGRVNKAKYDAMRRALMKILPDTSPGLSVAEARAALLPYLDLDLFPDGATSGWWLKCVQLDLEAKGVIARVAMRPLHIFRQ